MSWERLLCVPGVVQAHSNPDTEISDQVTLMQEPRQLLVLHLPWVPPAQTHRASPGAAGGGDTSLAPGLAEADRVMWRSVLGAGLPLPVCRACPFHASTP